MNKLINEFSERYVFDRREKLVNEVKKFKRYIKISFKIYHRECVTIIKNTKN